MIRDGIRRLFRLALHRDVDARRDVDEEVRLHLELRTEQLVAEGMTPADARAEAERRFAASPEGRRALVTRGMHRESTFRWRERMESFAQDLRYVLRGLRRSPGFTATVVVTLSLGLGANAALFAVLDRMFLQAPPGVREPEMVRHVYREYARNADGAYESSSVSSLSVFSFPIIRAMQEAAPAGVAVAGYRSSSKVPLGRDASAPPGILTYVVGDYFKVVGVPMAAGRPFAPQEYRAEGLAPVIILTNSLATERFGTAAAAIGRTIDLGLHRYTIVGVAAPGFRGTDLDASDAWAPFNTRGSWTKPDTGWLHQNGTFFISALARAGSDSAFVRAEAALTAAVNAAPPFSNRTAAPVRLRSIRMAASPEFMRDETRIATRLGGVALLILLIACANVANILLARASVRRREIAVRLALGVSRGRLVRQVLTESVSLAVMSGVGAVLTATWCAGALRSVLLPTVQWGAAAVGGRGIAFAGLTAVLAGFAAGLAPALHATRPHLTDSLRGGARDGASRRSTLRNGLLVSQVALSLVLLVGAGLFVRSLREVQSVKVGFDEDQVLFSGLSDVRQFGADVTARVPAAVVSQRPTDAAARIEHVPDVQSVALTEEHADVGIFVHRSLPARPRLPANAARRADARVRGVAPILRHDGHAGRRRTGLHPGRSRRRRTGDRRQPGPGCDVLAR